ncbi:MAG: acyltransferase [Ottowia sp.]|nr:acyltransferase [Ottowia sp.]
MNAEHHSPWALTALRSDAHVPALDGLRGIAVGLVLLFHALHLTGVPAFGGGFMGVDVFFVLSGYLITGLLLQEFAQNGEISLLRFYMRRFLRLMPALWAVIVATLLLVYFFNQGEFVRVRREAWWSALYISNWMRASGHFMDYLSHTWSLAMEEQFYLLWPAFLYVLVARRGTKTVFFAALALALFSWFLRMFLAQQENTQWWRLYHGFDTRFDVPMWGCALAAWAHGRRDIPAAAVCVLRFLAPAALVALLCLAANPNFGLESPIFYSAGSVAAAWLTLVLIADIRFSPRSWLRTALEWRPLVGLGVISYGVYLWHLLIPLLLAHRQAPVPAIRVAALVCAVPLALASFWFIERPFLRMKTRFAAKVHE